jgi:diketogulonate reductase-like aldo/keto reductase
MFVLGFGQGNRSPREILTVSSHRPDQVMKGLEKTVDDLGLGYLDLYLMHWPVASAGSENELDYLKVYFLLMIMSAKAYRH